MDGLKPKSGNRGTGSHTGAHAARPRSSSRPVKQRHSGEKYWLVRSIGKVAAKQKSSIWKRLKSSEFARWPNGQLWRRLYVGFALTLFVFSTIAGVVQPFLDERFYGVTEAARGVIPKPKAALGTLIKYDQKEAKFLYNDGYNGSTGELAKDSLGEARITASFPKEASKGMVVSDPINKIDFKMTPQFKLGAGKQDQNQLFYPLAKQAGYLVLTAQTASVKEDIILEKKTDDRQSFSYKLDLGDSLEARLQKDGSVGVFGSSLPINGNVATGSEADAKLLLEARKKGEKNNLLFVIPKPVVVEAGKDKGDTVVKSWFELDGDKLTVVSENLGAASYPLSIDPSVYVQTAAQLMRGNNETNVEFDIETEQFKKGTTTGARIDSWTDTTSMSSAFWDQGMAAANGYVYKAGGKTSRKAPRIVSQTTTKTTTATTAITFNMPANRPNTDLYVILVASRGAVGSAPSGLTAIVNLGNYAGAYYRYDTGTAVPATYTITGSIAATYIVNVLRIQDFNPSSIINTQSSSGPSSVNTQPVSYPGITPTTQGSLTISMAGVSDPDLLPNTKGFSPATMVDLYASLNGTTPGSGSVAMYSSMYEASPIANTAIPQQQLPNTGIANGTHSNLTFVVNGNSATTAFSSSVEWARFNSTNGSLDSPAPGSDGVTCSGWCTNSVYNLPTASPSASNGSGLVGASTIAYNGYLYMIGGYDGTFVKNTIYIAKLGANGEPSLWHPTDPLQSNWTYWYKDAGLGSGNERMYHSAYAYNGKMYIVGGRTSATGSSPGAQATVFIADILPNGTLGTFSAGPSLASGRYGLSVQGYNGYIYAIGGNNGSTVYNNVYYARINANGTLTSWQNAGTGSTTGSVLKQARTSQGGVMAGIWGGYLYVAGGCSAVNTTNFGNCTSVTKSVELASINADGTLNDWNTILYLNNQRFGYSFVAWQDSLYRFGGCGVQDATTGDCYNAHQATQYGNINQDGDASTVSITTASGTGNCVEPDPYDCNLPNGGTGSGQSGQALAGSVILNGYLYVIGGCTTNACTTMSGNTAYAAIDSNGQLKSAPSCSGGISGAWCVDSTNQIAGGVGAPGVAVFGGTIYIIGGQNGGATGRNVIVTNRVNADGSLVGAWTSSTFNSAGLNAYTDGLSYTYAYARANPASAGTNPGNLFLFGGCQNPGAGAGCTTGATPAPYSQSVYKCNITTTNTITGCTTTGQLQIGTITGATVAGLGIHAGTVYANYVYLIGGLAEGVTDQSTVRYAMINNSNNVVAATGTTWVESNVEMNNGRRRGTAFGYNGYIYAVGGFDVTVNQPLDTIEYVKVNVSDGSLVSSIPKSGSPGKFLFKKSAVTINQRWGLALAVSNSFAYAIGGCKDGVSPTCNTLDATVQTFQVYNNDSGSPGGFMTASNQFATNRLGASAAVLNGYMYIAGGCINNTDCTTATTDVQKALIGTDGSLGAWTATGVSALPASRAYGQLEVAGGSLYFLGGQDSAGTASSAVYYATMGSSGDISSWSTATRGIGDAGGGAQVRTQFSSAVWNNRIYVTGGTNGTTVQNTVYISPQLTGGNITGNWTTSTAFNVARSGHVAIAYANNLYILAGYDGTNYLSDVQYAKLDGTTGAISGTWTYSTNLPVGIRQADGFAVNGYMYIMGGRTFVNDCNPRSLVAPISANTTIASGNNPTGIGEWYETNRKYDSGRYGAAVTYAQGKAYVLGGGCQGVVMQDDFDPDYEPAQWSFTTGFTADTKCQSTSSSKTFSTNTGGAGNYAATKDVNVSGGGTVYFKLYIPTADTGTCFAAEAPLLGAAENVLLQYSTNGTWGGTTIATYQYNQQNPFKTYAVTIPAGAQTASTRFRWVMPDGEANDSFALEDVYIVANNNTTVTYPVANTVQTSLLSQPQVASYSRLIDAGRDVFPTNFLMNGIDNSIGARWQMTYRSMNDPTVTDALKACGGSAMTSFGSTTFFGDVTLGKPERYYSKNSGGTDIGCGRYYFLNITVDASQTYGYPDDIERGPTLDNFLVFFQSNPGQRLLHGKTFLEGSQQPLDTPCRQSGGANNVNCTLQ